MHEIGRREEIRVPGMPEPISHFTNVVRAGRLVFAARGAGPFQLAYGSRDAKSAAFPIATLIPGYEGEEERARAETAPGLVIGGAQAAADPQRLGGDAATRERVDWKRWTLWASLVLGVAVLGWMALRLGRQMSRPA